MCIVNEKLKQLYLDNAPGLVGWFIKRHKDDSIYFDTFEDMRQELLLSVWLALPQYDSNISKFSTYVVVVCRSEVSHRRIFANRQKRKGTLKQVSLNYELSDNYTLMNCIGIEEDPSETLCRKERMENLKKLLSPETYAYYIDGYTVKEIVKCLGKTENAVRQSIRRNIIKVRKKLDKEREEYESNKFL